MQYFLWANMTRNDIGQLRKIRGRKLTLCQNNQKLDCANSMQVFSLKLKMRKNLCSCKQVLKQLMQLSELVLQHWINHSHWQAYSIWRWKTVKFCILILRSNCILQWVDKRFTQYKLDTENDSVRNFCLFPITVEQVRTFINWLLQYHQLPRLTIKFLQPLLLLRRRQSSLCKIGQITG